MSKIQQVTAKNAETEGNVYILNKPPHRGEGPPSKLWKVLKTVGLCLCVALLAILLACLVAVGYYTACYSLYNYRIVLLLLSLMVKITTVSLACFMLSSYILRRNLIWFLYYLIVYVIATIIQVFVLASHTYSELGYAFQAGVNNLKLDIGHNSGCSNAGLVISIQKAFNCCGWDSYEDYEDNQQLLQQYCRLNSSLTQSDLQKFPACSQRVPTLTHILAIVGHILISTLEAALAILVTGVRRKVKPVDEKDIQKFDKYLGDELQRCVDSVVLAGLNKREEVDKARWLIKDAIREACSTRATTDREDSAKTCKVMNFQIRMPKLDKNGKPVERPGILGNSDRESQSTTSTSTSSSTSTNSSTVSKTRTKEQSKSVQRSKTEVNSKTGKKKKVTKSQTPLKEPKVTKEQVDKRKKIMKLKGRSKSVQEPPPAPKVIPKPKPDEIMHTEGAISAIKTRTEVLNFFHDEGIQISVTSPSFKLTRTTIETARAETEKKIDELDLSKAASLLGEFTSEISEENEPSGLSPILQSSRDKATVDRIISSQRSKLALEGPSSWHGVPSSEGISKNRSLAVRPARL